MTDSFYSYRTAKNLTDSTSTAGANQEKCPKCGKEDVWLVFDNVKPEEPNAPTAYKLCGDCNNRWKAE
jgi:DNA-directed RNA polymerase subunit M/transcription elongation factor TFIIS